MRTLLKSKIMLALLFTGLLFSCKNNNANTEDEGYHSDVDSMQIQVDTTSTVTDSTNVNGTGTNTTGRDGGESSDRATNDGSSGTGSGSYGR